MQIKSILTGAALALATTAGAATAGDEAGALGTAATAVPFSFLAGVSATPMGDNEMSETRGAFLLITPGTNVDATNAPHIFPRTGHSCQVIIRGAGPIGECNPQ